MNILDDPQADRASKCPACDRNAFVAIPQVATRLGLPRRAVLGLIRRGELRAYRFGRKGTRVRVDDLERFIEASLVAPAKAPRAGRLEWLGVVNAKADDLDPPVERGEGRSALEEAEAFLEQELASGPMLTKLLERTAEAAGISKATLRRARDTKGVKSTKIAGGWTLSLPRPGQPVGGVGAEVHHGDV